MESGNQQQQGTTADYVSIL